MKRLFELLRARRRRRYLDAVGPSRERPPVEPVRHLAALDRYEGMWVAVRDGEIIEAARSSRELVSRLQALGPRGQGATAQFVPPKSEAYRVGVG
jgi:hypothetical protein